MKIAIWRTGHEIADTVADALKAGLNGTIMYTEPSGTYLTEQISEFDAHIGYGILRGMDGVFRAAAQWGIPFFNVDRGYFNPGHFDGNYRISCNGTQARWHQGVPRKPITGSSNGRTAGFGPANLGSSPSPVTIEPWRTGGDYVLVCPPTEPVCGFFGVDSIAWLRNAAHLANGMGFEYKIRDKNGSEPLEKHLASAKALITFNSSVGWKALQMGIPVLSDPHHSLIGSYYKSQGIDILTQNLHDLPDTRMEIMEAMNAHNFSLEQIRRGEAWGILKHYTAMLDGTAENPSPTMSASIQYGSARKQK